MNLVLMTEGTGQGVRGRKTNVSRVYDLLVENGNQRINFEAGPGARFPRALGTFFGRGAVDIVNHHQNWFLNHAPRRLSAPRREGASGTVNDEALKIFLFGFSRGALIMRVFASWLCQRGFPVEYMGLWDTVDSTAGIRGEDYVELPSNVKFARHAVARDEFRRFFNYLPLRDSNRTIEQSEQSNNVEELLFPGCHSDVGGLYDDNHAIADVTLDWILEPALERGLKIIVPGAPSRRGADKSAVTSPRREGASGTVKYLIHDSLHEPTNAWGALDPVRRVLEGVKRHKLCDII